MRDAAASAPGRVNLIGEHTDYNGGFVLPMPIPQRASVVLRARADRRVVVTSRERDGDTAVYALGEERRGDTWLDYVMGCTAALRELGYPLGGAALDIASDVPLGAGLSSSAALELAVLRAFRIACDLPLDDVQLALLGQRAENETVGAPVGAMDQMVASLGVDGEALFIDMRSLASRPVALPTDLEVVVISSGIVHALAAGSGYRERRAECAEAARRLGVESLRDVSEVARVAKLPPPLDRRARHVVTENTRVLEAVAALERGDRARAGALFAASHASMRDDYEVSIPEIDLLVELTSGEPGVFGARLTGGGFGGSIVALAARGTGEAAAARACEAYRARVAHEPRVLLVGP